MIEHAYEDETTLAIDLAGEIVERLQDGVVERGQAGLVVTGGSTVGALYDVLRHGDLPWDRVWVTLSDERWVPVGHEASNARLVRERLLTGLAAGAHLVELKTEDATPQAALEAVDARIAALPRPFDAVVLGMGEDGHFASLFPGNPALSLGLDPICAENVVTVEAPGAAGARHRMSLTLSALTDSRWIALMIRGQGKLERLRHPAGSPIAALLEQAGEKLDVFWTP